jgi:hypothetical protein
VADKECLDFPFTEQEVVKAIAGMRTESSPGPNRFSVIFFKKLWEIIKAEIMRMVLDFNKAELDLSRINYGVIILVPKIKEASRIRQYKLICLLNVDFMIFLSYL